MKLVRLHSLRGQLLARQLHGLHLGRPVLLPPTPHPAISWPASRQSAALLDHAQQPKNRLLKAQQCCSNPCRKLC